MKARIEEERKTGTEWREIDRQTDRQSVRE